MAISALMWSLGLAGGCQSTDDGEQVERQGTSAADDDGNGGSNGGDGMTLPCPPQQPPTIEVPRELPATPVGVPVAIDVALTNHNPSGGCTPLSFQLHTLSSAGVDLDPPAGSSVFSAPVASGDTTHMTITATPSASVNPGDTLAVLFFVSEPTTSFFTARSLPLVVAATEGASPVRR